MSLLRSDVPLEISCREVKSRLDRADGLLLVDCRERDEYALVNIAGAQLLPMSELLSRVEELNPHKQQPVAIHCHHGSRSLRVAAWLRKQGFESVQSMEGGIDRWSLEIDPSLPRY